MEPFSAGTGSLSVISLAFQIAAGVNKLSSFLKSISEAPKEIESILEDLGFFNALLTRIQETDEPYGPDAVTNEALQECKKSIDALTELVDSLVPGFASQSNIKRKWTGVEAVMRTEKILKVKTSLQEAKLDLIAAQIVSLERSSQRHYQSVHKSLLPIQQMRQSIAEVHEMISSPSRRITTSRPDL
ncbi:hypothetical protein N431DRAFT_61683 [Stipitochalara longipes BDJ]|nr:hypothetical protein N431DRAFT_61683 [Stipitochalara longipes BDJ]